jgi:hypothetical protein
MTREEITQDLPHSTFKCLWNRIFTQDKSRPFINGCYARPRMDSNQANLPGLSTAQARRDPVSCLSKGRKMGLSVSGGASVSAVSASGSLLGQGSLGDNGLGWGIV